MLLFNVEIIAHESIFRISVMDKNLTESAKSGFSEPLELNICYGRNTLDLRSGCWCSFAASSANGVHYHNNYEICLVIAGQGEFEHGDELHALQSGDVFIADPYMRHEINSHRTRNLELVFIGFSVLSSEAPLSSNVEDRMLESFVQSHRILRTGQNRLLKYILLLGDVSEQSDNGWALPRESLMTSLTLELLGSLTEREDGAAAPNTPQEKQAITRAMHYMKSRMQQKIFMADVAAHSGVSERHLRRLFKKHVGCGMLEALNRIRIEYACSQLRMHFSVTEVALNVGFEHMGQFSRLFKQLMNLSPKAYQRQYATRGQAKGVGESML